jgi:hypothetical protein
MLVTALLVIPAAALIIVGDRLDPLSEAKSFSRKSARASADTTKLRIRLEELGKVQLTIMKIFESNSMDIVQEVAQLHLLSSRL